MNEDDKNLAVKFFKKTIKNNFKSAEEGKPVFNDVDYVSIIIPGNRPETRERKATDKDRERFAPIWEKYLKNEEIIQEGTMLEMLPTIDDARLSLCKGLNIVTIEQLANLDEIGINNLGFGARELITDAKKYIEGTSTIVKLEKENEEFKEKIKELEKEINKLKEKKDESTNNGSKRGGRDSTVGKTVGSRGVKRSVLKTVASSNN